MPRRRLQVGAGLFFQGQGFLDPVLDGAAGVQRQVELHAHAGGVGAHIAGGREAGVRPARDLVLADQVERGLVTGLRPSAVSSSAISRPCGLLHRGVAASACATQASGRRAAPRAGPPAWPAAWARAGAPTSWSSASFLTRRSLLGGNFLRQHQVEAGLRLARVGDGGGADLEVALGGGQLLGHGGLLGLHEGQRVLRGQHIEIGLRGAHDQVLLGRVQLGLGDVDRQLGLLVGRRLAGRYSGWLADRVTFWLLLVRLQSVTSVAAVEPVGARRQARLRQQPGLRLLGRARLASYCERADCRWRRSRAPPRTAPPGSGPVPRAAPARRQGRERRRVRAEGRGEDGAFMEVPWKRGRLRGQYRAPRDRVPATRR
jgi:hypothetical protein